VDIDECQSIRAGIINRPATSVRTTLASTLRGGGEGGRRVIARAVRSFEPARRQLRMTRGHPSVARKGRIRDAAWFTWLMPMPLIPLSRGPLRSLSSDSDSSRLLPLDKNRPFREGSLDSATPSSSAPATIEEKGKSAGGGGEERGAPFMPPLFRASASELVRLIANRKIRIG